MIILNDIHLGASRKAGTTQSSQKALTEFQVQGFRQLLGSAAGGHLVINGDLFDSFSVEAGALLDAYQALDSFMQVEGSRLSLVAGNHDHSPKGDKLSSFNLLSHILKDVYGYRVQVVFVGDGLTEVEDGVWAIPHCPNQDLFDLELEKAKGMVGIKFLLLHANFDNEFAAHADHSLNVSAAVARELISRGMKLVFGHVHQGGDYLSEGVVVAGNQIPSSISDCLSNTTKSYLTIENGVLYRVKCLDIDQVMARHDWDSPDPLPDAQFIRVTGNAKAEQAKDVVDAVARFRNASEAFVITNAVNIEAPEGMEGLTSMSLEGVSKFDVLAAILGELTEQEAELVKELIND